MLCAVVKVFRAHSIITNLFLNEPCQNLDCFVILIIKLVWNSGQTRFFVIYMYPTGVGMDRCFRGERGMSRMIPLPLQTPEKFFDDGWPGYEEPVFSVD